MSNVLGWIMLIGLSLAGVAVVVYSAVHVALLVLS